VLPVSDAFDTESICSLTTQSSGRSPVARAVAANFGRWLAGTHMVDAVSPKNVVSTLTELWSPRVIAEVDDAYIKVAKVQGSLAWHSHENEDELFLVL
jgi:hypothetical protein